MSDALAYELVVIDVCVDRWFRYCFVVCFLSEAESCLLKTFFGTKGVDPNWDFIENVNELEQMF